MLRALVFCLSAAAAQPATAQDCAVELVLAMDVSRSVDAAEFGLIRHGTAEAFRRAEIIELVGWLPGGVIATVTQWSGADQQMQAIGWRHLSGPESLGAFADEIDAMTRHFRFELTAPGEALAHAASLHDSAPMACRRRVIDIAGDGIRNTGRDTAATADAIAADGVTINGLVVRGDTPDPLDFYHTEIKRGALAFIEVSDGYDDFPRAMFRKLLRELTPSVSALPAIRRYE
ncbi:MAG: DUF1194 domain-containing protein [Rhodobacteraceae bacterium]|nr:DUF1194 domain-containing protein [Paracoccaceae bacterium]